MSLRKVASKAAAEAGRAIDSPLSKAEIERVTAVIVKAMESAVLEASSQHATACDSWLSHDQDLAHKIQREIERKKLALIANLSSLR